MKYYVIGDTGGHLRQLVAGLKQINVDVDNFIIPENVTIIHMGDLIHKGPHSFNLLWLSYQMQLNNPGRWIQLLGNHELQHFGGTNYFWKCNCDENTISFIRQMFDEDFLKASYCIKDLKFRNLTSSNRNLFQPESKDWLFVHGGLTRNWWKVHHSSETDVEKLSESINRLSVRLLDVAGLRLGYPKGNPSPIWASNHNEVYNDWAEYEDMPFSQITGHTYPFDWEHKRWFSNVSRDFTFKTKLNAALRTSLTFAGRNLILSVDPAFEIREPSIIEQPVIFIGQTE